MTTGARLPTILFVCIGNTCRSQMAEGFAKFYGRGAVEVQSAGTSALGVVVPETIETMREVGIDISSQTSDQLTDAQVAWADVVVTMGCCSADTFCPVTHKGVKYDWSVDDPIGMGPEFYARVRDGIEAGVKELLEGLNVDTGKKPE